MLIRALIVSLGAVVTTAVTVYIAFVVLLGIAAVTAVTVYAQQPAQPTQAEITVLQNRMMQELASGLRCSAMNLQLQARVDELEKKLKEKDDPKAKK